MLLISTNWPGNAHATAQDMNKLNVSDFVMSITFNGGNYSIVLLKVPNILALQVMEKMGNAKFLTDEARTDWVDWSARPER